MAKHPFLSPDWVSAAHAIHEEHLSAAIQASIILKMNLVVEEVPFGQGQLDAHVDTSDGTVEIGVGHIDQADVKINLDYDTARAILVEGDTQAGMAAFMAGKIRVEGDMSKLLSFQAQPPNERQQQLSEALKAITE